MLPAGREAGRLPPRGPRSITALVNLTALGCAGHLVLGGIAGQGAVISRLCRGAPVNIAGHTVG